MKNLLLIILLMGFFTQFGLTQPWIEYIENSKTNEELTLNDFREAFNRWEAENQIMDGKKQIDGEWEKVPGYKPYKRWEYFWDLRVDQQTTAFPKTNAAVQYAKYMEQKPKRNSDGNWSVVGPSTTPGGYAGLGRVNCIEFHPTDNNTFWIGTPSGGLWKTTDGGTNWECLTDQNNMIGVSDIALANDFATSNTMYIATGDRDGGSLWTLGGGNRGDNNSIGILKSTDAGETWTNTGLTFNENDRSLIGRILIDPTDGQIMLASTTNGIYRSTDGGNNWSLEQSGAYFIDMEFKPSNSDIVYASTSDYNAAEIYRSTDNGVSWSQVESFTSSRRAELAVTPHDATYVYAIVANSARGLKGIYKSTDSGANFTLEFDGNSTDGSLLGYYGDGSGDNEGQGSYDLCIAVNPTDKEEIFIGGVNTWKSNDGGSSWNNNNIWTSYYVYNTEGAPVVHADKHVLKYRETDGTLFEGNDGGIYKTSDAGASWTDLSNNLYITQIYRLGVSQSDNNMTIIGNQDNGTKLVNGLIWDDVTGGDGMECLIDPANTDIQYSTYVNGTLYRTTNGWSDYETISDNITGGNNGWWVSPYVIDPDDNQTLFIGYDKIWKTTDRGSSWSQLGTLESANKFRSLAISQSNNDVLVIADLGNIWYTTDGGANWTDITGTLPTGSNSITNAAIHTTDQSTIWVTMGGYDSNRVYQSTNGGSTWTNISDGLPQLPALTVVHNAQETELNEIYVGTDRGVYMKRGTTDFVPFMANLPNVVVTELEIYYDANPSNSKLRAATFGRGLWESTLYADPTSQPIAAFSATPLTGPTPLAVSFTNESTDATSWSWDFGDNESSPDQNPTHTYTDIGTYTVALTATNSNGSDTKTETDYITVTTPLPVAAFSGTPQHGDVPLTVTFTDASTNATSWSWDFGDMQTSTDQNPTHEFAEPGNYTVALTATNSSGSHTETKTGYITVNELQAVAQFEGNPTESLYDTLTVFFTNLSENANDFDWDFGDTYSSIEVAPSHKYMAAGVYTVSLTASNDYNSDTETKDGYIIVHGTGIDFVNEANLNIYPNPSSGLFNISAAKEYKGKANLKILDQKANLLYENDLDFSRSQQIDLSGQPTGIYYLLFEDDGKQFIKEVVIE